MLGFRSNVEKFLAFIPLRHDGRCEGGRQIA